MTLYFNLIIILVCFLCPSVYFFGRDVVGKGHWVIESAYKCPDAEQYEYNFSLKKRKFNRTHDVFDIRADIPAEVNEDNMGLYVESCIKVDGGCKLVYTEDNPSLCNFLDKYAPENSKRGFSSIGLVFCVIPKGYTELLNFLLDFNELPKYGMVGEFQSIGYFKKDGKTVGCVAIDVSYSIPLSL